MKSILIIFLLLTSALQAVEVKEVASISLSGRKEKIVTISVPEDTAELILVLNQPDGYGQLQSLNPTQVKQGRKFGDWDGWFWRPYVKLYRPEKGKWYFRARVGADRYSGSLKIYAVPYLRVEKPQTIALKPHRLCDKEYIKVIFSKDIVTPRYLEGVYGFEITTNGPRMDVIGYGGWRTYYYTKIDGMRNSVEGFEDDFDKNKNYYFEIKRASHSTIKHEVRINWYKAKIEAVAGVISPDRELWMVTHGRDDNPDNADSHVSFRTLAGTLSTVRLAEGVPASSMVLNWSEGAADNSSKISLEGSRFIKAVAQTAKRLLNKCGVKSGGPLNLVGHSWGSLVSENLAMEFWRSGSGYKGSGTKVGRLVALDPAESGTMMGLRLGGLILGDRAEFDGFHGSGPSHSLAIVAGNGLFGSEKRAQTALINIRLDIPGAYISDYITDMDANAKKHALPVDFFYHSIINRNARGISQTIWSLAKDKSSYGVRFPSGSDRVKLPGPLLGVESRYYFTNSKLDFSLGYKGIRLLKFDEFCGVVGVILNQSKQYNKEIWMGLGNAMWNNPPYYDGVTWFYQ